jgi:hypothetical protein
VVSGSLWRASSTSLGSICFGALIVAVIEALKAIVSQPDHIIDDDDTLSPRELRPWSWLGALWRADPELGQSGPVVLWRGMWAVVLWRGMGRC